MFNRFFDRNNNYNLKSIKYWIPAPIFIFSLLKEIRDPEFSFYLFNLDILSIEKVFIENHILNQKICISVIIAPTYNKCTMSTVIGLSIENILLNNLTANNSIYYFPQRWFWKFCKLIPLTFHMKGLLLTKQLNDKERISAAIENYSIRSIIKFLYYKSIN